jgi:hypothetical protein
MNIIKLQNELKSVPDDALIGYVQNPTGNVPSYLALSELQRRKDMRAKYQAQQAPQSSVAEDLGQQAQPQPQGIAAMSPQQAPVAEQGVAGLPIPDQMFSGQGMATGGIVAFDEGGDVPSYAGPYGSYVNPSLYGGEVKEYINPYKSPKLFGEDLYGEGLLGPNPDQDIIRAFENQRSMNPFISGMPRTDLADEYARLRLKASKNQATQQDYDRMNTINESMRPAENYPTGGGPDSPTSVAALKQSADKAAMDKQRDLAKEKEKAIRDIYAPKGGTRESVKSLSDYAKEFRDVVGEDPMQAKLAARMEKMDARSQRMEDRAPGMAMLEAGLNIASGTSPFALVNIGKGALAGVKSYGDAQDKMAALEEKRFTLVNDMAKAQRAEQLAIASKGVDSRDAQLARDSQEKIADKKMANDMQMRLLDNIYDLRGKEITAAQKDLPNAVERATKIDPLVTEDKEYKEGLKALEGTYGDKGVIPGSPNYDKYQADVDKLYRKVYAKKVRNPLTASSFASGITGYTPGQGFY